MNKQVLCLLALGVMGCATTLPPKEERAVEYIEQTKATKAQAYARLLAQLGKSFVDANSAIRVRNEPDGQIVGKTNVECNVFRQFGDPNPYYLHFDLDVQAKDNRIKISFEDLVMKGKDGGNELWATRQIVSREKVEKAKECLDPIRAQLVKAVAGGKDW